MRASRVVVGALVAALLLVASPVAAAQKTSCPQGAAGWTQGSVGEVAATIYAGLVEGPWGSVEEFAALLEQVYDRNGDDDLCLAIRWTNLQPASHWYGTNLFIVRDNNANG